MTAIDQWWANGAWLRLEFGDDKYDVFVRRLGEGSSMTLLHGFPSSSHDWAAVAPALARTHAVLAPDFLGFGASDKPVDHVYAIHEQADLVERMWAAEGVTSTVVVAHDYAVSVAQELLARHAEGALAVDLRAVVLLNGGLYPDLHRPEPVQTALLDPEQGPRIGALMNAEVILAALEPTFAPGFDRTAAADSVWRSMSRDDGHLIAHLLIQYINDRLEHAERWTRVLDTTIVPLSFVWGMLDPISGAHMAERIRLRRPDAPFTALEDVAHWPPIEAPERVVAAVQAAAAAAS